MTLDPLDPEEDWNSVPIEVTEADFVSWLVPDVQPLRAANVGKPVHAALFRWLGWNDRGKGATMFPQGDETLVWTVYWGHVKSVRSMVQWRTKFNSLGLCKAFTEKFQTWDTLGDVLGGLAMIFGGLHAIEDCNVGVRNEPAGDVPAWN